MAAPLPTRVRDPATASNPDAWRVEHMDLKLAVHMDAKSVTGHTDLLLSAVNPSAVVPVIRLDVHHLRVAAAAWVCPGPRPPTPLTFAVVAFASFGSCLQVTLTDAAVEVAATEPIRIRLHHVSGTGPAFCWLSPVQTAGKERPFMFTQGQACLNRSWFPCQDSPSCRTTWSAAVAITKPYTLLMSGNMSDGTEVRGNTAVGTPVTQGTWFDLPAGCSPDADFLPVDSDRYHMFYYEMSSTVPTYLLAMVAGDLQCARVGKRSHVWAEPCLLKSAEWVFGHNDVTEAYVGTGERLFGPYRWGQYDIVVMPTAFAYGGMENPVRTFVTPALLAEDQSMTDVVAHEIAHSWSGNLTTNASFTEFYLNEGFTMYLQRRITSEVHGVPVTALETVTGRSLLVAAMQDLGVSHPLTRLTVPLAEGIDPDETYTEVPYEKGFAFVSYLRARVGSDAAFDAWIKAYTSHFAFASVTSGDMLDHFFNAFPHLRGDWTRDQWAMEVEEEASKWWGVAMPVPEGDLDACGALPPLPAGGDGVDRAGLAYVPGYEFMRWLHAPGWPPFYPSQAAAKPLADASDAMYATWTSAAVAAGSGAVVPPHTAAVAGLASWPALQKLHFLDTLLAHVKARTAAHAANPAVLHALLAGLEGAYSFGSNSNAEIRLRWSQIVALAVFEPGLPSAVAFLHSTGKLKYVTPVMRALVSARSWTEADAPAAVCRDLAVATYRQVRPTLMIPVQMRVDGVMEGAGITATW